MKHLKFIMLFAIIPLGLIYTYKSPAATKLLTGPGFELRNQSNLSIMFRLFIKGKKIADTELLPKHLYQWEINLDDPIIIEVYDPNSKNIFNKIEINTKGKTKYIVWDPRRYNQPARYFFPQKRDEFLAPGVPVSPFNLENNIDQKDIRRVR